MAIEIDLPPREGEGISDINTALAEALVDIAEAAVSEVSDAVAASAASPSGELYLAIADGIGDVSAQGDQSIEDVEAAGDAQVVRVAGTPGSTIYASTAAGLSGTTNGQYFLVVGSGDTVATVYKNNSGSAVAQEAYPSYDFVAALETSLAGSRARAMSLDYQTDKKSPIFVDINEFIRSHTTPSNFTEATISSRDSATQFTVASGHGNRFAADTACVIKDDATGRYYSFGVNSVSGDVITVYGTLPASISVAQTMHDSTLSQHLSRFGYKGLGDFVCDAAERYGYKKPTPLFAYNPALCTTSSFNTYNIRDYGNTVDLWTVTRLGTASGGGFVSGTTNLFKLCQNMSSDDNPAPLATHMRRQYRVTDATAGSGVSVDFDAEGYSGFVVIPVAALKTTYTPSGGGSATTSGRVRLVVQADGTDIFDQTYAVGEIHFARVDFTDCSRITVRVTTADATISDIRWFGCWGWAKSDRTPTANFFKQDDVIVLLMDSWGEFPLPITGETLPTRYDGSTAQGMQYFGNRIAERLADDGIRCEVFNLARGGQTTAWARYWAHTVSAVTPRPTKVIMNFAINDQDSRANVAGSTVSVFDFDPDNMWAQKNSDAGGIFGSVSYAQWFENVEWLCDYFGGQGIQPIVLMPPITGSVAQTSIIQQYMLQRIVGGFDPFYDDAGRTP